MKRRSHYALKYSTGKSEVMYKSTDLEITFDISEIYTIHYFEYFPDFDFAGETHDFWEFIYVDKGEVDIIADHMPIVLHKSEIAFHKPNEFHAVKANGKIAPNLVVISFTCNSPAMSFFRNKVLSLDSFALYLACSAVITFQYSSHIKSYIYDNFYNNIH